MSVPPLVSVCIPVYNGLPWIETTIASVLAQTMSDFEIIVRDDCSTDGTVEILTQRFGSDPRLRTVRNEKNVDVGEQYDRLFADARGEFIVKLDADDLWAPTFLERTLKAARDSDADVVMAGYEYLDTQTGATRRPVVQRTLAEGVVEFPARIILQSNPFSLCFGIWRRSLLARIQRDGQYVLYTEICDWECQLRLGLIGARFSYIDDILGWYRLHGTNRSYRPNTQMESALCDVYPYWYDEIARVMGRGWVCIYALRSLRDHVKAVLCGRVQFSRKVVIGALRIVMGHSAMQLCELPLGRRAHRVIDDKAHK